MKQFFLTCLLLSVASARKQQKISLDDIERDNLSTEKGTKLQPPPVSTTPPAFPRSQSPTQYGFVPTRTAADYEQQQPKQIYLQPHYSAQQYNPPQATQTSKYYSPQRYSAPQQYALNQKYETQQQYSTINQKQAAPQQYTHQQQFYTQRPQVNQHQLEQYENVQYITDNSISQREQQYYTPQYVYLQQYQSPSTAVQSVVDPKTGLQYLMYFPSYVPNLKTEETQNVFYIDSPISSSQEFTSDANYQTPEPKYTSYQTPETQYTTQYVSQQPERTVQQVQYSQPEKPRYNNIPQLKFNREPKSLLDSYVPSVLQIQYYKQQQQAQLNALKQSKKLSAPVSGKVEYVKSHRPQTQEAESSINYNYQLPRTY